MTFRNLADLSEAWSDSRDIAYVYVRKSKRESSFLSQMTTDLCTLVEPHRSP